MSAFILTIRATTGIQGRQTLHRKTSLHLLSQVSLSTSSHCSLGRPMHSCLGTLCSTHDVTIISLSHYLTDFSGQSSADLCWYLLTYLRSDVSANFSGDLPALLCRDSPALLLLHLENKRFLTSSSQFGSSAHSPPGKLASGQPDTPPRLHPTNTQNDSRPLCECCLLYLAHLNLDWTADFPRDNFRDSFTFLYVKDSFQIGNMY